MGSDALRAALRAYGRGIKRLGVVTPYMPVGDRQCCASSPSAATRW
jgi:maleate isomerase